LNNDSACYWKFKKHNRYLSFFLGTIGFFERSSNSDNLLEAVGCPCCFKQICDRNNT